MSEQVGALRPCGYRVLVEPESGEKTTEGGIVIPQKERIEQETGVLAAVGPLAWKDHGSGEPWAEPGDRIIYAKYGGRMVTDPDTGREYRLLNDEDISLVIKSDKSVTDESYFPE